MADRRRRPHSEGESDEESTETSSSQSPRKPRQSECESEGDTKEAEVSDYESATEDNGDKEEEDDEEEETDEDEEDDEEEEDDDEEEYEDEDVIIEEYEVREERQSGDGEEQPDNKKLDDDEDRKNPAFIPRQGAFYEHDLRLDENGVEDDKRPRKKLWQDEGRWYHDRYSDNMQGPKSREELIVLYGYDIRQSDKPPDAPPPRRGGPRRPRMGDKPHLGDFMKGTSRDDSYLIERRNNEYNKNRYFRGKSEEYHKQDEEQSPQPSFSGQEIQEERYQPEKYDQWNSRFEENQSYRRNQESNRGYDRNRRYSRNREGDRGYGRDSNRDYGRNQDSRRGPDRNYDSNRRNQDHDHGYDRNQDSNRGYERSWRDNDNRSPRYDNRNYREYRSDSSSSYDYPRGGRYNNRGYRNDPPRREYTYSRDRGQHYRGGGRSRPDRGRGGPPRRTFETERKIPPRFQKKKEARLQGNYNTDNYIENEQMHNYYPDTVIDDTNYQEGDQYVQSIVKTEIFTPSNVQENAVVQQAETVDENLDDKNENVIVQSNVSERNKSYSKDRRVRTIGKTRVQDSALNAVQEGFSNLLGETEASSNTKTKNVSDRDDQRVKQQSQGNTDKFQGSKQDGGRTKRYSSQRQRNPEQLPQENVQFFAPDVPKGYPKKDVGNPQFQQAVLRPPINYPIPVSTSALPNAPPQRLFRPPPVTGPVPIIPPQFINTGVIYGPPPAPAPYPVTPIQGFPSPPPVSTAPPPPIPAGSSPNQLQEVYRHGTTYYPPELQYPQMKKRSPVKRTKSAIPIVNPEEVSGKMYDDDVDGDKDGVDDGEMIDDRDTKLQQTIDREFGFEENSDTPPLYENQPTDQTVVDHGDVSEKRDAAYLNTSKNVDNEIDDLSSNVKRLTTDISNYTIAFSTEQEVYDKGDHQEDTSHEERAPVSGDRNSVLQEKSSPVLEEELAAPSSSQEVTVS